MQMFILLIRLWFYVKLLADLNIPINPEVMLVYTYMDMEKQQAPRFNEYPKVYPEIYKLQKGKAWIELSLNFILSSKILSINYL